MDEWKEVTEGLALAAANPKDTVRSEMKRTGRRAIGCFPMYAPDELIHGAGFLPVGMWGGGRITPKCDGYLQSFCCSVMRANLSQALEGDYGMLSAVLIPMFCDTLKCVGENWKAAVPQIPAIPMVYPQNLASGSAIGYLEEEFLRVRAELELLSGKIVTEQSVGESLEQYERSRKAMREFTKLAALHPDRVGAKLRHQVLKAGYFLEVKEYTARLERLNQLLLERRAPGREGWTRLIVTGLMLDSEPVLELFDRQNIVIAADDLAQESRRFRVEGEMAARYLDQRGDPFLCSPAKRRGENLIRLVRENHAQGVVVVMMKFCDPEEFDYPIYRRELEEAQIPCLYLELEQKQETVRGLETRLEGFLELLAHVKEENGG